MFLIVAEALNAFVERCASKESVEAQHLSALLGEIKSGNSHVANEIESRRLRLKEMTAEAESLRSRVNEERRNSANLTRQLQAQVPPRFPSPNFPFFFLNYLYLFIY